MRDKRLLLSYLLLVIVLFGGANVSSAKQETAIAKNTINHDISKPLYSIDFKPYGLSVQIKQTNISKTKVKKVKKKKKSKKDNDRSKLSEKEIKLIALVTMAEAEGECKKGKRLVIDTILNRVDSKHFPNTVNGVIYQKHQFTSMWNGRVDEVKATKEVCNLVKKELKHRTNDKVMFFTAHHYGNYGKAMFHVGNHYFSSYD